jgi:hypothetical protein
MTLVAARRGTWFLRRSVDLRISHVADVSNVVVSALLPEAIFRI